MPGHAETIRTAAAIPMNVAGVSVFGMGRGASRPRITFASSTEASILISAANCSILNVVGIAGVAGLTQPFDITGDDCALHIEWQDGANPTDAARAVLATGVSRLHVTLKYRGFTNGQNVVSGLRLIDCTDVQIDLDAYGTNSVGWVELAATLSTNVFVGGRSYTYNVTDGSHLVVDTVGGSVWGVDMFDIGAGGHMSGGSGSAIAPAWVSAVQLKAILDAAGLLDVGDELKRLKLHMQQIRFGVSMMVDQDLTELDSDPLTEL
jgi:hypothetical protein